MAAAAINPVRSRPCSALWASSIGLPSTSAVIMALPARSPPAMRGCADGTANTKDLLDSRLSATVLPGTVLEMPFDLAVGLRLTPAPCALIGHGACGGVLRERAANVRRQRWHNPFYSGSEPSRFARV